ncbi:MAG: T9SS type A sorting domain-containing protein, partial [Mameliella sp.]|nr:T9SS type A sorting domain-containing protein [Phaeodactylibacter sp.]
TITDNNTGCTASFSIELLSEGLITAYTYECTLFPNGTALADFTTLVWSDGQTPYTFTWSTGFTETTNEMVSTLQDADPDGTYAVTITDDNGCTGILKNMTADCSGLTTLVYIPSDNVQVGEQFCLPVKINNINAITRFDAALTWSTDHLSFNGVNEGSLTALLTDGLDLSQTDAGQLTVQWDTDIPEGEMLENDDTLFEICFEAVGDPGTQTDVAFDDNILPGYVENGAELPATFQDGTFTILDGFLTAYSLNCTYFGDNTAQASISCAVWTGGVPPYTFNWNTGYSVQDTLFSTLENVPANTTYSLTITDAEGTTHIPDPIFADCGGQGGTDDVTLNIESATVVPGEDVCLDITVDNFTDIGSIQFSVNWDTDYLNFEQIELSNNLPGLDLASGFNLNLTDEGTIAMSWFEPSINTISLADGSTLFTICFQAGTQSGTTPVTFSPNPVSIEVTDLENTLPVTLQNGTVEVLPIGVWSTAYSYDCLQFGDGTAQASVSCVIWAGGTPPYTFDWSTGFSEQDTLFSTLENVPANTTYSLTITDAEGNTYIPDAVFPDCNVSNEDATVTIGEAIVNPMANFCVPVTISGVSEVTSLEAGIAWLPGIINYTGITGGVLGDETSFTIEDSNLDIGQISIMWEATAPDAILVNDGDVLFELCFDAVGTSGSSTGISFSEAVHPFALGNVSGTIVTPVDGGCFISGTGGPDDVTLTIESAVVDTGEVVCLDVSVANFTDIGSLQFSITWDTDHLQYDTILLANNLPGLTLASGFNLNLVDDGIVALAWFEPSINTVSLADGSTLFTLCLQADTLEGPTPVTFSPTPVNIEVTDLENTLPVVLQNGTVDVLQPDVWPGDTDVDGLVTHFDLLNIGLGFGAAGPERNNATIAWEAQFAPGWTASTPVSNVNYKHLDTNGDGFIDAADTLALVSNWGEEVNLLPEDENRMMTGSIYIEPDTVVLGEQTTFNIMLGEPGNLVPEVYGIAFTIVYDSAAVAPGSASTSFLDSWIGNANEDIIGLSRDRFDDSRIDVAITRTDGINAEGSGAIGQLHITIQDVIFMRGEDYPLEFDIENIRLINADETDFQVTGLPSSGIVKDGIVNTTAPEQNNFEVQAFPNPANDLLRILVRGAQLEEARLIATDGRLVHRAQQRTSEINVQNLPEGLYMLQVVTDKGQTTQRIVITH